MTDFLDRLAPLAWTQIWQVTLVAAAIAVLTRLSCRNRPHLAYVLWLIVLIKCLTPPIWSSPTGVFSWAGRERVAIVAADATPKTNGKKAQEITERTEIRGERRSTAAREEKPSSTPTEAQLAMPPSNRSVISPQRMASEGSVAPHGETRPDSAAIVVAEPHGGDSSGSRLVAVLFDIWLGGVIVYSIVILRALLGWRRVFRASVIPEDDRLSSLATDLARRLGIRRRVTVRLTNEPLGPVAVGWFRPAVLLPKALVLTRTLDEIEPLLAHELIHIRRGDALVGLLQIAAGALWWFHPLVWWANRQIARERERSCDEEVVASLGCDPGRYARGLLDVLELKHRLRPLAALPGVRPFDITKQRLEHIMQPARQFQRRPPRRYWIVLLAGFLVLAPAAGVSRTSEPNQTSDTNANVNAVKSVEASAGGQSSSDEQQPRTEGAANNVATATSSQNSRPEPVVQMGHMGQITCVAFSPDGHYVLTGSNDGSAIVWRAETGRQLRTIHTVRGFVQAVEFTTDSKNAIIASSEGVVVIYDLGTGKLIRELIPQDQPLPKGVATNRGPIPTCLATGPDGKQLLIGYQDGTASLWDLGTGEEVRTLQGRGEIDSVAFDPKGKYLATNGWGDDVAVLWDLATGEKVRTFQAEKSLQSAPGTAPSPTSCVAFMPNGTELLAGALDNTVISWDVGSGERLRTFQGNRSLVISLAVNDDGTQVTTRNAAGTVILWDVKSRRKIHTLQAATHAVPSQSSSSVAFSPNGTLVLAVSDDGGAAL
ncbi:MAG TPA: M56 family metallopeptidase, partial [Pirellulales bacterium]|nr:M56 family metallopeptidase [Pirellulales bacterium]